jgi:hypothetical protein
MLIIKIQLSENNDERLILGTSAQIQIQRESLAIASVAGARGIQE